MSTFSTKTTIRRMIRENRKAEQEKLRGRIDVLPNHWLLKSEITPALAKRQYSSHLKLDNQERHMVLIRLQSVACPDRKTYGDRYAIIKQALVVSVPYSVCQKCPLHHPRKETGYPYPTCQKKAESYEAWLRAQAEED